MAVRKSETGPTTPEPLTSHTPIPLHRPPSVTSSARRGTILFSDHHCCLLFFETRVEGFAFFFLCDNRHTPLTPTPTEKLIFVLCDVSHQTRVENFAFFFCMIITVTAPPSQNGFVPLFAVTHMSDFSHCTRIGSTGGRVLRNPSLPKR
jgi:hypothetical protein